MVTYMSGQDRDLFLAWALPHIVVVLPLNQIVQWFTHFRVRTSECEDIHHTRNAGYYVRWTIGRVDR